MPLLRPPKVVLDIVGPLERAGFETWCVGGAVRDALLGHRHLDWDLATAATPDDVRRLFGARRTIPVGVEFGTVGVLDPHGVMHEVTTFRRDVTTDGRHAVVAFGVSLDDDLARRDFTVNAIAYSPSRDVLHDPFGGRADLDRRVIRAVGDPDQRLAEDRLRALRALRFAARLGFTIDPETLAAISRSAPFLSRLSAERVKQELDKTMEQVARPSEALVQWVETGILAALVPQLAGVSAAHFAIVDRVARPDSSSRRPERQSARRWTRWAAMLSAVDGREATRILERLRGSRQESAWIGAVVDRWREVAGPMTHALVAHPHTIVDADVRRWVAAMGRLHAGAVMRVAAAAWAVARDGGRPSPAPAAVRCLYRRIVRAAFRDALETGDLAVDGDDLRRAGIPPGPELGKILHALLASVLEDASRNRTDWLLQEAKRLHEAGASARR